MDANGNIPELNSYWTKLRTASSPGAFSAQLVKGGAYFTTYVISLEGDIFSDAANTVSGVVGSLTLTAASRSTLGQKGVKLEITGAEVSVTQASRLPLGAFLLGDDVITGSSRNDIIRGLAGNDVLSGRGGSDLLYGGGGDDVLHGSTKDADILYGEAGNDVFLVRDSRHVVIEAVDGGSDTVIASVNYVLRSTAEVELLQTSNESGAAAINLTGSGTANTIVGNAGANILSGRGGEDTIYGGSGKDTVEGGTGADHLFGGAGFDQLNYAHSAEAVIIDLGALEGYAGDALGDLVVEFESVLGSSHSDTITGDLLGNLLDGARGNDLLAGAEGNDTLIGGRGNDSLVGGDGFDRLDYSQDNVRKGVIVDLTFGTARDGFGGQDAVSNFEEVRGTRFADRITGGIQDETLRGEAGRDRLTGGEGNDRLFGGAGHDTLTGGSGQDVFVFDSTPSQKTNVDKVTDFSSVDDIFYLNKKFLKNIGWVSRPLKDDAFHPGKTAEDAYNRIIYDKATGSLFYDPDGSGSADQIKIAILLNKPTLDFSDFFVI